MQILLSGQTNATTMCLFTVIISVKQMSNPCIQCSSDSRIRQIIILKGPSPAVPGDFAEYGENI